MANTFETSQRERDPSREARESKEKEIDPELAAAAMMERADLLVKEVKTNKQQIQNIVLHMAQVKQAIQKIRKQLQLQQSDDDALSPDEKQIEKLKAQIVEYKDELLKMKDDLIHAYANDMDESMSAEERVEKANMIVMQLLQEINE